MDINLKVSPAELEAKATDFKGVMSQIKTLTDDMMACLLYTSRCV